jgi:hypothetical protein
MDLGFSAVTNGYVGTGEAIGGLPGKTISSKERLGVNTGKEGTGNCESRQAKISRVIR